MPLACSALEANWNLTPTSIFTVRIRISMCRCWKEGEGKKRPAGKMLQMRLTAAGRLPVSRCREQQSETEKNKSKQISALVSVSGVEWRLLAALKGASGSRQRQPTGPRRRVPAHFAHLSLHPSPRVVCLHDETWSAIKEYFCTELGAIRQTEIGLLGNGKQIKIVLH